MKRKFFSAIFYFLVVFFLLAGFLKADDMKNAVLVQAVKAEYQALWKSMLQKYVDAIERAEKADDQYVRDHPACKGTIRNQAACWASTISEGFNEIFSAASSYDFDKAAMLWNAPDLNKGAPRHAAGHTLGWKDRWPEEIKPALGALRQFYSGDDINEFEHSVAKRIFLYLQDFSNQVEKTLTGFFTSLDQKKLIYYYSYDKTTRQFSYTWPACAKLTNFFAGKNYDI
ncbi:MAG TPA: hypothetical protein PKV48_02165, partial [Thermodesulfobacteriota bacterium]|nr:hypothetical protein [Thermodesulfobacteriota bacterium]